MEIISDVDRVARMKKELHDFVESQFPFKRFFPSYGIGIGGTDKQEKEPVKAGVVTNEEMATTIKATISEQEGVKLEKVGVEEKLSKKRLNKPIKIKLGKGRAVISLHRA